MGKLYQYRGRLRAVLLTGVLALALVAPPRVEARSATPRAVKRLYKQGQAHYYAGRYREALEHFRKAVRIHPHPSIFLAIAQTYRKLDKLLGALSFYRRYKAAVDKSAYADIDEKIKEVEDELAKRAEARREADKAQLTLVGVPAGARVSVDGSALSLPADGKALALDPGVHRIVVEAEGFRPWGRRLDLKPKATASISVTLTPASSSGAGRARAWLIAGIIASAVALGMEATALAFTAAANDEFNDTDTFDRYKATAITGHVLAVLAAGAAALSWTFYFKRRREQVEAPTSVRIAPSLGGFVVSGRF